MNYFPPEWHRQSCIAIAWPQISGDFAPRLNQVEAVYRQLALEISSRQTLVIICCNAAHRSRIEQQLQNISCQNEKIIIVEAHYDDVWVRDTLPISVLKPDGWSIVDFAFNGWGGKYAYGADASLASQLYQNGLFGDCEYEKVDLVLEGGAVDTDGQASLLATPRSIMDPARNPNVSRTEIETLMLKHLGITRLFWLDCNHLDGDDTGGHIDTLARFCTPDIIAFTSCEDRKNHLFEDLRGLYRQLEKLRTAGGHAYKLLPLPLPQPIYNDEGQRLPATYANFLIVNDAVLMPAYADPMDKIAANRLRPGFPGRRIIPVDCRPLIQQFGSLHCATMQFPDQVQPKQVRK